MNYFLCKCDKNQNQDEKTAMDLLNIKNLERSLKNKEKKINLDYNSNRNTIIKDNLNSSDEELEIIEYPYPKEININNIYNNQKIIKNRNHHHLANLPKTNNINMHNKLFNNNDLDIDKNDLNNSSLNNESLIVDDIEYLNDEDTIKLPQKIIKIKENNNRNKNNKNNNKNIKYNKISIYKVVNKNKKSRDNSSYSSNGSNSRRGSYNKFSNSDSIKLATKVLTLNGNNKKINNNRKINSISQRKEDKMFLKKISNNKQFNIIDKPYKKNKKVLSLDNSTTINNNKQKIINDKLLKTHIINKDNKIISIFNNKRINKRRINFKKVNLDLNKSKK